MNIKKFLKLIVNTKISFIIPKRKVVFFDYVGFKKFENLYNSILEQNTYFILKTRIEHIDKIFLNLNIIFNLIIYYFKNKNIKTAYLISLILEIDPKIVITNIDNSIDFSLVAKKLHKFFLVS